MIICICRLLFNQAHLGLFIPLFQILLSVSRQARTALPNGLILILLFEMCRALNFNLGHSTCCDYVVFSSTIYLEFTFYPFLYSVRSQPVIEHTTVDLIKRLSKTFVSLTELHPPAAFLLSETSANTFALCQLSPGLLQTQPVSTPCFPLQSHVQFGHVFAIVRFILSALFRYLD